MGKREGEKEKEEVQKGSVGGQSVCHTDHQVCAPNIERRTGAATVEKKNPPIIPSTCIPPRFTPEIYQAAGEKEEMKKGDNKST